MNATTAATLFAALIALASPGPGHAHHAVDFDNLRRQIEDIRNDANVPGAALVIVNRDGIIRSAGFGVADNDSGEAVTPDTAFRIGSVTKIFTAAALVQLARREDFSLDDPVSRYLPAGMFHNRWEAEQPITVADLLEHTSGFRDWTKAEFDHNVVLDLEQGLAFSPQSRTTYWKPGLHSVYSNSNYGLAGLVLERVSGQKYEALIRDTLFDPLEMRSATSLQARTAHLATGYDLDGRTPIPYWHMIQRPAAAINATPRDMAALVSMLLAHGSYQQHAVLTPAEVNRIESPRTSLAARSGLRFGYGLGIYAQYRNGFYFMGHGGDGDGYLSRFGYCRQLGVGYFLAINSANPQALRRMRRTIENELTRDHRPPAAPPIARLDANLLHRYSGRYALAAWRFDWQSGEYASGRILQVSATADGRLFTQESDGERKPLLPVSEESFRRTGQNGATSGFYEDGGLLYFQEDDNWVKVAELAEDPVDDAEPARSGASTRGTAYAYTSERVTLQNKPTKSATSGK